jgi:hypothetical protein
MPIGIGRAFAAATANCTLGIQLWAAEDIPAEARRYLSSDGLASYNSDHRRRLRGYDDEFIAGI